MPAREQTVRHCIVSGESRPVEEMLRFVCGPDGVLAPDLARKLPGRGVWVTGRAGILSKAVRERIFARALRRDVAVPDDLAQRVDQMLERSALQALSISQKAGLVVVGFRQVDSAIRAGKASLVLHATDAAEDGVRKLDQARHATWRALGASIPAEQIFRTEQLDLALGRQNVVHAAAIHGGATRALVEKIGRLRAFRV